MKFLIFIATLLLLVGSLMAGPTTPLPRKPVCVKACNDQFQSCKESGEEPAECAKEKKDCKKACKAPGKPQ
ncbi:Uncharacterised protein g1550 [Pycnogonum litorale]